MPIQTMTRKAADNVYLHRDFHNIFNLGLDYLMAQYGPVGVAKYLADFALHYYSPIISEIQVRGLTAIRDSFMKTYAAEEATDVLSFTTMDDSLLVHIAECPAVRHMRNSGVTPSPCYSMTTSVVWQTLCESTDFGYSMLAYDPESGKAEHLFFKKTQGVKQP